MTKSNMTDDELIEHGYKEYKPTSFDHESVEKCFQKRFDDDIGKKYFITVRKWSGWTHPYNGLAVPAGYEASVQFCSADTDDPISMTFHASWRLTDVEKYVEALFQTGLFRYYEKWEDC